MTTSADPVVERVDEKQRYEILIDGKRVGLAAYRDRDGQRVFHHTEVDEAFAGQGLASRLVREALADTRDTGKRIVPVCPYVVKWVKKHDEFADAVDRVTPEILNWLRADLG